MYSTSIVMAIAAVGFALCQTALAASSADWRSRSIYQVMTDRFALTDGSTSQACDTGNQEYCGGTWVGITNKLDYIQNMGFDAIWISPVTAQMSGDAPLDGSSYHGYWQTDLYDVNSAFGTVEELQALSAALHDRSMYLMVDVVTNHNAYWGEPADIDYSVFNPFNDESYYHTPYCAINYTDYQNSTNVEQCWEGDTTVPLVDLRTEDDDVASEYQTWISELVSNYSIDGLRIDSVMQVDTGFWSSFSDAAGVYAVGEVDIKDGPFVCGFQDYLPGILNYAIYFPLFNAFSSTSGSIADLVDMISVVKQDCADPTLMGSFSENHDQPRFASVTGDMSLAQNVISYTILSDGIPIIYEGQEQHFAGVGGGSVPYNREAVWLSDYDTSADLYAFIGNINAIRKNAIADDATYLTDNNYVLYSDTTTIAMRKGSMVTVLSNKGADGSSYNQTIASGYDSGTALTEMLTCGTLTADSSGNIAVPMASGLPRVYYPTSGMSSSGFCGTSTKAKRVAKAFTA